MCVIQSRLPLIWLAGFADGVWMGAIGFVHRLGALQTVTKYDGKSIQSDDTKSIVSLCKNDTH